MTEHIHLRHIDYAHMKIETDVSVLMELCDYLTFYKQGYKFDKRYVNRMWDGKIRLVNRLTAQTYAGLAHTVKKFCDERGYHLTFDPEFQYDDVSREEVLEFIEELNLPEWVEVRDYQVDAITKCVQSHRRTLVSPTSCQMRGDKIWTRDGLRNIEDVREGDMVCGEDGTFKEVLATHSGFDEIYRVVPSDPELKPFHVTADHVIAYAVGDCDGVVRKKYASASTLSGNTTENHFLYINDKEFHVEQGEHFLTIVGAYPGLWSECISSINSGKQTPVVYKNNKHKNDILFAALMLGLRAVVRKKTIVLERGSYRCGFTVEKLDGTHEYFGLQVEDRHYLTESGFVTHNSGKSFMIYAITQWYKKKALIIVPTTGLVVQMQKDIESFGYQGKIHVSTDKLSNDLDIDADIVITTWQSLNNGKTSKPEEWYQQFEVVFGDEAHGCKAPTLIQICTSLKNAKHRFGTTGTLDNDPLHRHTIFGLFGAPYRSTTTRELIDSGFATDVLIKCIVLDYSDEIKEQFHKPIYDKKLKKMRKRNYQEEIDFITNLPQRNQFIHRLSTSLGGNRLVFFKLVEHGKLLYDMFKDDVNTYYIDGSVKKEREQIRVSMDEHSDATLLASLGTTSTGVSIRRLEHMIMTHPMKGTTKLMQSIGRMLRQFKGKDKAVIFDIVDNFSRSKSDKNYCVKHFEVRYDAYNKEKFETEIMQLGIK